MFAKNPIGVQMPYEPSILSYPPYAVYTIYVVWTKLKDKERWMMDTVTQIEEDAIDALDQAKSLGFTVVMRRISATTPEKGAEL